MSSAESSGEDSVVRRPDWPTLLALVLLAVLAGGNPVAVRFSNAGLPPFWGASLRFGAAALVFWIIVLARGIALPRGRALAGNLIYGLLSVGASYAFLYWGLVRVPAGLAGALLALVPLMTLFFAWVHRLEALRWRGLIGALIATGGVLLGIVGGFGGAMHVPSVLAVAAGTACLAESAVVFKIFPKGDPMVTNAIALTVGVPILAVLSRMTGEEWRLPTTLNTWTAYAYLVLVGSVTVFYLYLHVLSRWTASATSYAFLLMPVSTVIIAAVVAGEPVTAAFVVGTALVIAGVWVGAIGGAHEQAKAASKGETLICPEVPNKATC